MGTIIDEHPNSDSYATDIAFMLSMRLRAKTDCVATAAIGRFLGTEDWCFSDIRGRLARVVLPDKHEIFYMDGVALFRIGPPHFSEQTSLRPYMLSASRTIEILH